MNKVEKEKVKLSLYLIKLSDIMTYTYTPPYK